MKTSRLKPNRYAAMVAAALAIAGMGAYWMQQDNGVREPAPIVGYTLLDGTKSSLELWRGKVVLVNFWATSCAACVHEMPQIVAMHEKFNARGYEPLAVAMSYDPPAQVIGFAQSRKLPFAVAIDNTGTIARGFGNVKATPTSMLINKRGQIVARFVGEPDFAALHRRVEELLAEG